MKLKWLFNLFAKSKQKENQNSIHDERLPWEELQEEEQEEYEDKQEKERNRLTLNEYKEAISLGCLKPCDYEDIWMGSRFLDIDIEDFLKNGFAYLNKIQLQQNLTMSLKIMKGGTRNFKKIFVSNHAKETELDIRKHLNVEDSIEGAWQAFLLRSFLDKINSIKLFYIFSNDDVNSIKTFRNEDLSNYLLSHDITPYIGKYNSKYFISYCFFSQWGGLIRQNIEISITNNQIASYRVFQGISLYRYECGFMI